MTSPMRFALIGCGKILRKHAVALQESPLTSIAAVCDTSLTQAEAAGQAYHVPYFTDVHEMLSVLKDKIDVLTILTPSGTHADLVSQLTPYGKPIIVEKPLALRLSEADAIIETCRRGNVPLFVVKQNRYNRPVQKMRQAFEAGRFGKIVMGTVRVRWRRDQAYYDQADWRGTWRYDGGVFANQASHHIDLLEWFMGEPVSVFAKSRRALVDIEAEDTGVAIVRFKGGALAVIEATTAVRPKDLEGSLSLLGETGSVEIGGFSVDKLKTWEFTEQAADDADVFTDHGENPKVFAFNHRLYLEDVVRKLQDGISVSGLVDGYEGRKSLELITAIYESIETGQEITLSFEEKNSRLGLVA